MDLGGRDRRGILGGLRVPVTTWAVVIALGGFLLGKLVFLALGALMDQPRLADKLISQLLDVFPAFRDVLFGLLPEVQANYYVPRLGPDAPPLLSAWELGWALLCGLSVWSFMSAAIGRIAALKIARDESLSLGEALAFGARKAGSVFVSFAAIGAFMLFFAFVCNGIIAGWIGRIPYAGELLVALLFPLVLLSTFLAVLLLYLTIFGFSLIPSAIATESSESFDGISRAFNYVYSRPWDVILLHGMTLLYMGLFGFLASRFLVLSLVTVSGEPVSWLGMGPKMKPILDLVLDRQTWDVAMADAGWSMKAAGFILFYVFEIVRALIVAYLIAYWFGAGTTMYFILRRDVEGEDYDEIYLEDEEEDLEELIGATATATAAATTPPTTAQTPPAAPPA